MKELLQKEEKKVEYLELIYDLIFVYIIGRNNSLLHLTENGTISFSAFMSYVVCTLAVIQIWNFSTYYINKYGIFLHIISISMAKTVFVSIFSFSAICFCCILSVSARRNIGRNIIPNTMRHGL